MATFMFNIAKGRAVEFYNRVENNDPATSALIIVPCSASDTEANAQDADNLTAAIATAINEATAGGWARKTLTDAELGALPAPDDTNNRYSLVLPEITWTAVAAANNATGFLVCYDADTATGTDANIIPISHHDFTVTTNGNDVTLRTFEFFRAS